MVIEKAISPARLDHLDAIRGLAAMAVCLFHFSHGGKLLPDYAFVDPIARNGYLGVEVFFILSGFVIPWMLWKTDYRLIDFGRFFTKRMVRLYPPFLVANLLIMGLNFASQKSPWFQGPGDSIDPTAMALSFVLDATYLTGIMQWPWISVVSWTLAIEVQFYIVAGLLMSFLPKPNTVATALALTLLASLGLFLTDERFVFSYLPFFALGWSGAFYMYHKKSWLPWLSAGTALGVILYSTNWMQFGLAAISISAIVYWKWKTHKWLLALGTISYSLYLVHVPIGGRVVNLGLRFAESGTIQVLPVMISATVISLVLSAIYWRFVESPAQKWSRKLLTKQ